MARLLKITAIIAVILSLPIMTRAASSSCPTPWIPGATALQMATPPALDNKSLRLDYTTMAGNIQLKNRLEQQTLKPLDLHKTCVPGRIPTFAFVGVISAVGTYTLYGAGAGIVTAGLVYVCTNGNRHHTRMAIWGCVAGMAVGGLAKWISVR